MNQKKIRSVLTVLFLVGAMCGCSVKGIQSPIVLRSPVVLEEAEVQAPTESPEPARPASEPEAAVESAEEELPSARTPSDIVMLSDEDLADPQLSILARIYISIPADKFTQDNAIRELKVEAFERFGPIAYGIANIEHSKKTSVVPGKQDQEEVSADVITLTQRGTVPRGKEPGSTQSDASVVEDGSAPKQDPEASFLKNIRVLSRDDLYHLHFRIVGRVNVHDRSKKGYTREEVIEALKREAVRSHGEQAMGLSNIQLVKKDKGYYYEKARRSFSLTKGRGPYKEASADVVSWDRES